VSLCFLRDSAADVEALAEQVVQAIGEAEAEPDAPAPDVSCSPAHTHIYTYTRALTITSHIYNNTVCVRLACLIAGSSGDP
jgi:hypothetical protein